MIEIPLSKTGKNRGKYVAVVDDCDGDLAPLNWTARVVQGGVRIYASRGIHHKDGYINLMLHNAVFERMQDGKPLEKGQFVDHINGNGLDNRRANLRRATHIQNVQNRKMNKPTKSGYKGVTVKRDRFSARIVASGKAYNLGTFDTAEDAHSAYKAKAQELFGEFANDGFNPIGIDPIEAPTPRGGFRVTRSNSITGYKWILNIPSGGYIIRIINNKKSFYFGFRPTIESAVVLLEDVLEKINRGEILLE